MIKNLSKEKNRFCGGKYKNNKAEYRQRICRNTHGLVSSLKRLSLFHRDEEMAISRSETWRVCDDGSMGDDDSKSSLSDGKLSYSVERLASSDTFSRLDESCLWEIYTATDCNEKTASKTKTKSCEKVIGKKLTSPPHVTPRKSSRSLADKNHQSFKLKPSLKQEKITEFFRSEVVVSSNKKKFQRHNSTIGACRNIETTPLKTPAKRTCTTEPRKKRKIEESLTNNIFQSTPKVKRTKSETSFFKYDSQFEDSIDYIGNFSDSVDLGVTPIKATKECISCHTNHTSLWRDVDESIPLCNACGIRWRKYNTRCTRCWYIPLREEKGTPYCSGCGYYNTIKSSRTLRRYRSSVY